MSDIARVQQPIETATGLPNRFYTDPETFATERDRIFFAGWSALAFGKDIPNPGDVKPVELFGMPLLIVRDPAGEIGVFQNTCRHRGMILVAEPTHVKGLIRCPYHSWCYSMQGALKTTPHVGGPGQNTHPGMKHAELGLTPIRRHVWRDVIFVNVSGDAAPFESLHADLMERWAEFDQPLFQGGPDSSFKLDVKGNWKLAVENYCEAYHLPWVHPGLNAYSRLEDHYSIEVPGKFSGQGTRVYDPSPSADGRRFQDFAGLSAHWNKAAEYVALAPNLLLGVHRDHAFAIILEPRGIDQTREHIELYYASPEMAGEAYAPMRANNAALWKEIFEEDIFVVEGMQKGRQGIYFDGGKFSPAMDGPTYIFHQWVAERMA